jgi:hypothetical protein
VLIATDAQETRDMIRILANLYKSRGEAVPVLTAADFRLDDDASGIGALLDSVSNEHHRTCARRRSRTSFRSPRRFTTTPSWHRTCKKSSVRCGCVRLRSATWRVPSQPRCRSTSRGQGGG